MNKINKILYGLNCYQDKKYENTVYYFNPYLKSISHIDFINEKKKKTKRVLLSEHDELIDVIRKMNGISE